LEQHEGTATGVRTAEGIKNLQFPSQLGENEYNQFVLFTSYQTTGTQLSAQRRRRVRDLTDQIEVADEKTTKLMADYDAVGRSLLGGGAGLIALATQQQKELERLTTEREGLLSSTGTDQGLGQARDFVKNLDLLFETESANSEGFRSQFINDRSINTVTKAQMLGLDVASRRDITNGSGRIRLGAASNKSDTNIALYIPNKLVNSGSIGYNGVNFELIQAAGGIASEIFNAAGNFADGADMTQVGKNITNAVTSVGGLGARTVARIADGLASVVGVPLNATEGLQQVTGLVINPRQQQVFQGVQSRGFDFTFSFAPKNQKEAVEVSNIIRAFRKAAHPSISSNSFLNIPDEFEIRYYKIHEDGVVAENLFLNKIGRCALTAVNVDFTPNGINATFEDGSPVRTSLTLQFSELRPLTRDDIEEGY